MTTITCSECPFARHSYDDRFICANDPRKMTRSHHAATAECREAIVDRPRYFTPSFDLKGLDPEWVVNRIKLSINFLDTDPDIGIKDGESVATVAINGKPVGSFRQHGEIYYSRRIPHLGNVDPYLVGLNLVHPDYLHGIADEILADREAMPDYA